MVHLVRMVQHIYVRNLGILSDLTLQILESLFLSLVDTYEKGSLIFIVMNSLSRG